MGNTLIKLVTSAGPHLAVIFLAARFLQLHEDVNALPSAFSLLTEQVDKYVLSGHSDLVRTVAEDALGIYLVLQFFYFLAKGSKVYRNASYDNVVEYVKGAGYRFALKIPVVGARIQQEVDGEKLKLHEELNASLKTELIGIKKNISLPKHGVDDEELLTLMRDFQVKDRPKWKTGKVSGGVYNGDDEVHWAVLSEAYKLFSVSNPLHPDIWPSVMKFDAEVCSMTASMVNGGDTNVCAATTSGGTESIFMSIKTHRQWARETKGIYEPEIICPVTAHAAFDKACELLNITLIHVPIDPVTMKVDPKKVRSLITSNTIMLVGSAPQFPHGIIDPIKELSELAYSYGIGMHVDCCLGGFVLPFAKKLGYDVPEFDFGLRGVTAMSSDTHKYGYASKGTSVVLYRSKHLRKYQYFSYPKWPGGLYITPGTAGSRSGALIACAWTALMRVGEDGYLEATKQILDTTQEIRRGIENMPGLVVLGDPKAMIVAFDAVHVNVVCIADRMKKMHGWSLNILQRPMCVHICVTRCHEGKAQVFLDDLRECFEHVKKDPKAAAKEGNAPVYGLASSLPAGPVDELLTAYTDCVLEG